MKKLSIIALVVLAGASWACRKNVAEPENPYADAPWAIDESLPVPIQFGATGNPTGISTKALPIENMENVRLNIIAYDLEQGVDELTDNAFLFNKVLPAIVDNQNKVQFTTSKTSNTVTSYYYPNTSSASTRYNYTFFAYHIPPAAGQVIEGFEQVLTTFQPVNGEPHFMVSFPLSVASENEDILVAYAKADDYVVDAPVYKDNDPANGLMYPAGTYKGYNAVYQRIARLRNELAAHQPVLQFSHCMSQIKIKARAASADAYATFHNGDEDLLTVRMDSLVQQNAYNRVVLDVTKCMEITDYLAPDVAVLTWDKTSQYAVERTKSYAFTKTVAPYVRPTIAGAELLNASYNTGIFIVPGTDAPVLSYSLKDNSPIAPVVRKATLPVPDGGFLPGRVYTYYVDVQSIEQVSITVQVAPWTTGDFGTAGNTVTEE